MKLSAIALATATAFSLAIAAADAATVRDHRGVDPSTCPGGVVVNGQCATTVKPPRCPRFVPGTTYKNPCYYRR
jgi:hypothetical protein